MKTMENAIKAKHKKAVDELGKLEIKLINAIGKTGDDKLMKIFSEWQDKRITANTIYLEFLKSIVKT